MSISTMVTGVTAITLIGDSYQNESLFSFLYYVVVLFFGATLFCGKKERLILIHILLVSSLFVALYTSIYSSYSSGTPLLEMLQHSRGIYSQFNHYGYFLTTVITLSSAMFIYSENKYLKVFYVFVFVVNTFILQFNDTFGAWLAVFTTLFLQTAYYIVKDKKWNKDALAMFILFLAITALVSLRQNSVIVSLLRTFVDIGKIVRNTEDAGTAGTTRWSLWTNTAKLIVKKPFFGYGIKGVNAMIAPGGDSPHNEILEYASTFGVPAVLFYLSGIVTVVIKTLKNNDKLSVACLVAAIGYFISSLFGNTWYYTTPYFFILLGLAYSTSVKNINSENNDKGLQTG